MPMITSDDVLNALRAVQDPDLHRDLVSLGFIKGVRVDGGRVAFTIELTTPACPVRDVMKQQAMDVVRALPGVTTVDVTMTAQVRTATPLQPQGSLIPGIKHVVPIASGKGGVGKSTVASNLAIALKKFKKNVLLVDCNLSTPHLSYYMGTTDYKGTINDVLLDKMDTQDAIYNYNGVKYLPASVKFEDLVGIDLMKFKKHLSKLEKGMDFIILDAAPGLGKEALFVMDASTEIMFVTQPFVPMVADVIRCKEIIKQFGGKKMTILLNMVTYSTHELKKEVIEKVTQLPVMGEIPYDDNVVKSMVMRYPLMDYKPDSLSSISFMRVASLLSEKDYDVPMKMKWHKLLKGIKNVLMPSGIKMSDKEEDVRKELLSNF